MASAFGKDKYDFIPNQEPSLQCPYVSDCKESFLAQDVEKYLLGSSNSFLGPKMWQIWSCSSVNPVVHAVNNFGSCIPKAKYQSMKELSQHKIKLLTKPFKMSQLEELILTKDKLKWICYTHVVTINMHFK